MGEIEKEDGVLVIKRILVTYHLEAEEDRWDVVERVHAMHHQHCPVYRSICEAIEIRTEVVREEP